MKPTTKTFEEEFEAGHLKSAINILDNRVKELEEHVRLLYNFIGRLPQHVSDIEDWRSNEATK